MKISATLVEGATLEISEGHVEGPTLKIGERCTTMTSLLESSSNSIDSTGIEKQQR